MDRIKRLFLFTLVSVWFVGCGDTEKPAPDTGNDELPQAKGYYTEGSRKYKIEYGGVFRVNEVEDFKNLHPPAIPRCNDPTRDNRPAQDLARPAGDHHWRPCRSARWRPARDGRAGSGRPAGAPRPWPA